MLINNDKIIKIRLENKCKFREYFSIYFYLLLTYIEKNKQNQIPCSRKKIVYLG